MRYQELFSKKWFFISVLISLLFFQLVFSFLSPSCGSGGSVWEPIGTLISKFTAQSVGNPLLAKIYPLISRYSLHTDGSYYLELGRHFSSEYYNGHMFLERPLWPFLIFLSSSFIGLFITVSYPLVFGLAIFINFILTALAVILLFLLLKDLFSLRVAWLSSILFIFSPFLHSFLNQPIVEILTVFTAVLAVYLLRNYVKKPSVSKLIVFSLIIGILMLGKLFFVISLFILLLAVYFRRYKEGAIFLAVHLTPLLFWYFWVTQVWQIGYYSFTVEKYHMGVWLFDIFNLPWQVTYRVFLDAFPNFIAATLYGFLVIPVLFSIIGFQRLPFKSKNILYFGSIFTFLTFFFLMNTYTFRHAFLLFPIIYPTCVLGIDRVADSLKRYKPWLALLFCVIIIGLIILVSNINLYQLFDYNGRANSVIMLN